MTTPNGAAVPPHFYAFSALAVVLAVGVTWVVTRSSAPTTVVATGARSRQAPPSTAAAGSAQGAPSTVTDGGAATGDALAVPTEDGGGLPLPQATRAELAIVAPLAPGARLGDAEVVTISHVDQGVMRVISRRGAETIDLAIALVSVGDRPAAAKVGRYAIYHYNTSAPSLAANAIATELSTILGRNGGVAPPPGMTEAPR